jgi:outer membrane protein OmpA-like peptidoglycan-associated protein
MRRLFFLVTGPLLFDACVALWLGVSGPKPTPHPPTDTTRAYTVLFDWGGVELSASGRRTLAAAARATALQGATRVEVLGGLDHEAGPAYTAALAMERARRVRTELLRDGVTPADIGVAGPGVARSTRHRLQLVLQWTS